MPMIAKAPSTWTVLLALLGLAAGCGTIEPRYKPALIGDLHNAESDRLLSVRLAPSSPTIKTGDELFLTVQIRNVGREGVWLPRQPAILVAWIYPNGLRDNFLRDLPDTEYFGKESAVWLAPGEQIKTTVQVHTYYFDRPGITEFRALLHVGRNTHPDLAPCWTGRLQSNAYGVLVEKGAYRRPVVRM